MRNLMPFDELNTLRESVEQLVTTDLATGEKRIPRKEAIDLVQDLLVSAFVFGVQSVNEAFEADVAPDMETMRATIYRKVADEDFSERVSEYADTGDVESILRVAETDTTRVYNEASITAAKTVGAKAKTWHTQFDGRVRDTHAYLENIKVPIDAYFYTFDGDSSKIPGGFALPQNNVNCRCFLTFDK